MKKILLLSILLLLNLLSQAQNVTSDKIHTLLSYNDLPSIKKLLISDGFVYKLEEKGGIKMNMFKKDNETLTISIENDIYTLVYITDSYNRFNKIKSDYKTDDMVYKSSYKNNDYYVNNEFMLGINDINKVLSFFIKIKHN